MKKLLVTLFITTVGVLAVASPYSFATTKKECINHCKKWGPVGSFEHAICMDGCKFGATGKDLMR